MFFFNNDNYVTYASIIKAIMIYRKFCKLLFVCLHLNSTNVDVYPNVNKFSDAQN